MVEFILGILALRFLVIMYNLLFNSYPPGPLGMGY